MSYQNFEELEVWKKACELKIEVLELVKTFPPEERFGPTDQLEKNSRSVPSQIAEGHGRRTSPGRLRFCIIARGSLAETLNHLNDALDSKYISEEQLKYFRKKIAEVERLLN